MFNAKKYIHLLILCLALAINVTAQTPGLIIKPATGGGASVLDPDGDGYVSQKTNGIQQGFTIPPDNDVIQSEIPYVALVRPDVQGDLERGPIGGFTEIVGTDAAGNNAILTYSDNNYLYYRFRLSGYAPNSKSYSILIDTDQKFGFTGPNADPNAVTGNPGFEAEIVLETNFNVYAYNVDGSAVRPAVAAASALYDNNCQKSVAASNAGGDPDYFYDFYLPYPTLLFNRTTALRYVALTSMNPFPAIGNNAVSDVGGVGSFTNLDQAFTDLVNAQTPTLPGAEVLGRTACPSINSVGVGDASILGTTVSGAIVKVYVYDSYGMQLGSGTAITTGTTWSLSVANIKNASNTVIPLVSGYKVRATATASGMGESYDNCDTETITDCVIVPLLNGSFITSNTKGICASAGAGISGAIIKVYDQFGVPLNVGTYTVASDGSFQWKCNASNANCNSGSGCLTNGQTYFVTQTVNGCESQSIAFFGTCTTSTTPAITTSSITTTSTTISGTGISGSIINIYSGNNQIATGIVNGTNNWTINIPVQPVCSEIIAKQIETGKCLSLATAIKTITRTAITPSINNTAGCSVSIPSSISGISTEIGSTIRLYKSTDMVNPIGSATVVAGGTWTVSTISPALVSGDIIKAKVATEGCFTESPLSYPVTITTQTNISNYTITFDPVTEQRPSVSGNITGTTYPVTLKLYIDGTNIGSTVQINQNGGWSISGLNSSDLYVGGKVQATVTGSGCESGLSSYFEIVKCQTPAIPSYTGGNFSFCDGEPGQIKLTTSETGVIYQLVNGSGVAQGPASSGTGSSITLYTYALNASMLSVYVKAYKIGNNSCYIFSSNAINFSTKNLSPSYTFTSTNFSVAQSASATTVHLAYSAISAADTYTIDYSIANNNIGFTDVSNPTAITPEFISLSVPGSAPVGTYEGTITLIKTGGCTTSYGFTITVFKAGLPPLISVQPADKTICSGGSIILTVTAASSSTLTYQWQSSSAFAGPYNPVGTNSSSYTTAILSSTTYYRVTVTNGSGSVTSNVATITVPSAPAAAGSISGTSTVCQGQNGVIYSVGAIANATSYTWTYSGTGAFLSGSVSSIIINFSNNATSGTLSVQGTNSCGSGTVSTYLININPLPTVAAGPGLSTCSNSGAVNITSGASASNYSSVAWISSGTGTFANANSLTDATYTSSAADITAGNVTLTLTVTGSCGTATSTKTLTITAAPVATAGGNISTCTGMTAIPMTGASASGTYTGTPTWSGGAGSGNWTQNADPAQAIFTPSTASGSFTATLTLNGCSIANSTRTITWGTAPTGTFIASPGTDACINENVTYTTELGKANYIWTVPGSAGMDYSITTGGIGTGSNTVTIKWLKAGSKTVSVKYDDNGCTATSAVSTVEIHPLPPIGDFY